MVVWMDEWSTLQKKSKKKCHVWFVKITEDTWKKRKKISKLCWNIMSITDSTNRFYCVVTCAYNRRTVHRLRIGVSQRLKCNWTFLHIS